MPKPDLRDKADVTNSTQLLEHDVWRAQLREILDVYQEQQLGWATRQENLLLELLSKQNVESPAARLSANGNSLSSISLPSSTKSSSVPREHLNGMPELKVPGSRSTFGSRSADKFDSQHSVGGGSRSDAPIVEGSDGEEELSEKRPSMQSGGLLQHNTASESRFDVFAPKVSISPRTFAREIKNNPSNFVRVETDVLSWVWTASSTPLFKQLCMCIVIADMLFSGILAEMRIQHARTNLGGGPDQDIAELGRAGEATFVFFYSVELIFRAIGERKRFFRGSESSWNLFDLSLVIVTTMTLLLNPSWAMSMTYLRILRVFKQVMRALRLLRVVKFFVHLRVIMLSIARSMKSFFWALVTLGLIMYMCAMVLVEGVATLLVHLTPQQISDEMLVGSAIENWGSFAKAMFSEFKAITGGVPWGTMMAPIQDAGPVYFMIFILYIAFLVIAVLRLLTGIFVQEAATAAKVDQERAVHQAVLRLFTNLDQDDSGTICFDELQKGFANNKEAAQYLSSLQFTQRDMAKIFNLMDHDGNGTVDINEFINVMQSFKGNARKIDVAIMHGWVKEVANQLSTFMHFVEKHLDGTSNTLNPPPVIKAPAFDVYSPMGAQYSFSS